MIVLGINDGFDAGAAIIKDGEILSAVNEERITRIKFHSGYTHGWPYLSLKKVLELSKISPDDIDYVAISTLVDPPLPSRIGGYYKKSKDKKTGISASSSYAKLATYNFFCDQKSNSFVGKISASIMRPFFRKFLAKFGIKNKKIFFVDHHLAHAMSAYYTCGKKEALVITMDGHGDGLSGSISVFNKRLVEMIATTPSKGSVGWFYSQITHSLGFKMHRHEGKITGLAAFGDPQKAYPLMKRFIGTTKSKLSTYNKLGYKYNGVKKLNKLIKGMSREEVAAAAQKRFEEVITAVIHKAAEKTNIKDVALAGGVFANVRVNQEILELNNVDSVFIHPHMGDGGMAVGAALAIWSEHASQPASRELKNVYFGTRFDDEEIKTALKKEKLKFEYHPDVEKVIAELVNKKKIVGRFNGSMEYGPRALGNRSILADPTDKTINDWLNKRLKRTEFMPFAPSVLDKFASKYFHNYKAGDYPARFMTITFDCTEEANACPAVVHVDGTARPQVVAADQNPSYYKILKEYQRLSGLGMFVNTSYNMHEEPIVHTPYDAIRAFKLGSVDVLAAGNFIVTRK